MKGTDKSTTNTHPKARSGQSLPGYDKKGLHAASTSTVKSHIPEKKHTNIVAEKHLGV